MAAISSFTSCCNQQLNTITEDTKVLPAIEVVDLSEVLYADKLCVSDSCLVVINRKADPFFYIYNKETFLPEKAFGILGDGPEDFIFPLFLEEIGNTDPNTITVYDVNRASFKQLHLTRLLTQQDSAVTTFSMPPALIGASVLIKDQTTYYGNIDSGEGLFFIYHSLTDKREWIRFPESLLPAEGDFTVMNANCIAANVALGRIAAGMKFYNKVFLYDTKSQKLLKEVQIGPKEIRPIIHEQSMDDNNRLCCMEIHATEQYICLLMQSIQEKDWEQGNVASRVIILDWDLNYVKTCQLPHYTKTFAIDPTHGRILYTAIDDEGNTKLYHWTDTMFQSQQQSVNVQ